jgi:hypothetical protein
LAGFFISESGHWIPDRWDTPDQPAMGLQR